MNQILYLKSLKKNNNKVKKFKIQLFISLFAIILFILYWFYFYNSTNNQNVSDSLLSNFNIERIYSNNQDYTVVELNKNYNFYVIGVIEIKKINIRYPILSNINDDLLKISACKFYGPYPNEAGNLCIAAHNYDDNRFFGNLDKLDIGDIVNIYDLNSHLISYYIYDKFETSKNNTDCTSQDTNNKKEITLVTCNNLNKKRLIVKAKEK